MARWRQAVELAMKDEDIERLMVISRSRTEAASISDFLENQKDMIEQIRSDLMRGLKKAETGRSGLTAQQVLRSLVLMRIKNWNYRELRERIADGCTLRQFTTRPTAAGLRATLRIWPSDRQNSKPTPGPSITSRGRQPSLWGSCTRPTSRARSRRQSRSSTPRRTNTPG
jgi:hypothetical protein